MKEEIMEFIDGLGAKSYKQGISWKGFNVYIPQYKGNPCIGLPFVVLEKDEEVRLSTAQESLDYLAYEQSKDLQDKDISELKAEATDEI